MLISMEPILQILIFDNFFFIFFINTAPNYIDKCNLPTKRSILVKEEILQHDFYTNNIDFNYCEICLELQILDKQVKQRKEPHTCQKC